MPDLSTKIVISAQDNNASGTADKVAQSFDNIGQSAARSGGYLSDLMDRIDGAKARIADAGKSVDDFRSKVASSMAVKIAVPIAVVAGAWAVTHPDETKRMAADAADSIKESLASAYDKGKSAARDWSSTIQTELDRVVGKASAYVDKAAPGLGKLGKDVLGSAAASVLSGAGDIALNMGGGAIKSGAELDKLSHSLGLSVGQLSELKSVAAQTGIGFDVLSGSFSRIDEALHSSSDNGKLARLSLEAMGISIKDASGELKTHEQILVEVADKMRGYSDAGEDAARKNALLTNILGSNSKELMDLVNEGPEAVAARLNEAARLKTIFTDQMAADANKIQKIQQIQLAEEEAFAQRRGVIWADLGIKLKSLGDDIIFDHKSLGTAGVQAWDDIKTAASSYMSYLADKHPWLTRLTDQALQAIPALSKVLPDAVVGAVQQAGPNAGAPSPVIAALRGQMFSSHGGSGGGNGGGAWADQRNSYKAAFSNKPPEAPELPDEVDPDEARRKALARERALAERDRFLAGIRNAALVEQSSYLGDTFGADKLRAQKTLEDELANAREKAAKENLPENMRQSTLDEGKYWANYRYGTSMAQADRSQYTRSIDTESSRLSGIAGATGQGDDLAKRYTLWAEMEQKVTAAGQDQVKVQAALDVYAAKMERYDQDKLKAAAGYHEELARLTGDVQGMYAAQVQSLEVDLKLAKTDEERAVIAERLRLATARRDGDWTTAATEGLDKFAASAKDTYPQISSLAENTFASMDNVVQMRSGRMTVSFGRALDQMANDMMKFALRSTITGPLASAASSALGSLFSSDWSTGAGSGYDGNVDQVGTIAHRAAGGPVSAGKAYNINEQGLPEMFVPGVDGYILSASQTKNMQGAADRAGSGGTTIVFNQSFTIQGGSSGSDADAELLRKVSAEAKRATNDAVMDILIRQRRDGGMLYRG